MKTLAKTQSKSNLGTIKDALIVMGIISALVIGVQVAYYLGLIKDFIW